MSRTPAQKAASRRNTQRKTWAHNLVKLLALRAGLSFDDFMGAVEAGEIVVSVEKTKSD